MSRTYDGAYCDTPGCPAEAFAACTECGGDVCTAHDIPAERVERGGDFHVGPMEYNVQALEWVETMCRRCAAAMEEA